MDTNVKNNSKANFDRLLTKFSKEISLFPDYQEICRSRTIEEMKESVSILQKFETKLNRPSKITIVSRTNPIITSDQKKDELLDQEKRLNVFNKKQLDEFRQYINKLFKELRELSKVNNIYWNFCSFDTFKRTYKSRLEDFITKNKDCSPEDFSSSERDNIISKFSDSENKDNGIIMPLSFHYQGIELKTIFDKATLNKIKIEETAKLSYININDNSFLINESKNPYPDVFKDIESYNIFLKVITGLNALDTNNKAKNRKFKPIASSIFTMGKQLFIYNVSFKDYVKFLIHKFKLEHKDLTRLSDGYKHNNKVKEELNKYLTNKSE